MKKSNNSTYASLASAISFDLTDRKLVKPQNREEAARILSAWLMEYFPCLEHGHRKDSSASVTKTMSNTKCQ